MTLANSSKITKGVVASTARPGSSDTQGASPAPRAGDRGKMREQQQQDERGGEQRQPGEYAAGCASGFGRCTLVR